ncbi:hypothetical protein FQA39_LY05993 [Lamprigera yunnana]|nr:hypothetical protein FQA39_LY05993 [Lamprigera yunnana]
MDSEFEDLDEVCADDSCARYLKENDNIFYDDNEDETSDDGSEDDEKYNSNSSSWKTTMATSEIREIMQERVRGVDWVYHLTKGELVHEDSDKYHLDTKTIVEKLRTRVIHFLIIEEGSIPIPVKSLETFLFLSEPSETSTTEKIPAGDADTEVETQNFFLK